MTRVTVKAPSRLHFGLLGWGPEASRQFGGVGLMVERPGLELVVAGATEWLASGPLADRAIEIARAIDAKLAGSGTPVGPCQITIRRAPESHVGLGSGTQLGMALARALSLFAGVETPTAEYLARLSERGRRSGIGIHGFMHGGLIVDAGRNAWLDVPTHLLHLAWPDDWSVLLVLPSSRPSVHGQGEIEAFERLSGMAQDQTDRLCRLVLLGLLPGVIEADLPAFGDALEEMQAIVGQCFAEVQRGQFATSRSEPILESLLKLGLRGLGQSSWGPCLYGFSDVDEIERERVARAIMQEYDLPDHAAFWTSVSRSGAIVTVD